ncbi:uncharacterized protein LOC127257288 [Andrographis paniculata]|uniref:uncharacterized protein LOC127257288 n=1 Tax=Andrographis paniculata TaxID=175694 RepID=UPI0021E99D26|nr:uncharacterized protein LOC127257288 [Andrographis paniculata]
MDDIADPSNDFQDWELLLPLPQSPLAPVSSSPPAPNTSFHEIIDSAEGALLEPNYFSLDSRKRFAAAGDPDDDKSAASDNPSWIDPGLDDNPTRYLHKDPGGFWSDSSSERSQDRNSADLVGRNGLDVFENDAARPRGNGKIPEEKTDNGEGLSLFPLDSTGFGEVDDASVENNSRADRPSQVLGEEKDETLDSAGGGKFADGAGNKINGDLGKRSVIWWRMPSEILKYCAFKMSPVWAVSVAAAVMGFVILGRKLYRMKKKKTRALEIKLIVGDKNITQVMNHASRLNDAFSIVRRVPVIRPSLPAVGTSATWPIASLR